MNYQQKSEKTRFQKTQSLVLNSQQYKQFNVLDSSFRQFVQQNSNNKQAIQQVLKKVSQTIVRVHSSLVPKTQKLQIYRDLSRQQHQLLQKIKNDPLTHTIYAGVMAIESCLKQIGKQQNSVVSRLMKGVTVMLANFKNLQTQIMKSYQPDKNTKAKQSLLRLWDSMKLTVSDIHKLPIARMKNNDKQKHNEIINQVGLTDDMLNTINKDENLLFSLLVQQNNHQRVKIGQLEKKLLSKQTDSKNLLKDIQSLTLLIKQQEKQKLLSSPISSTTQQQSPNNETASQSRNTHDSLNLIKQLNQQLAQKNQIIKNMNYQFTLQIQKYDKIFHKLEQENKQLRKYSQVQMVTLIEGLQYEIGMLKEEKRQYQSKFNHLVNQIKNMAIVNDNNNIDNYNNYDENLIFRGLQHSHSTRQRVDTRLNPNPQQKFYQPHNKRSRCPSVPPTNKQQNIINRYLSPNFEPTEMTKRNYPQQQQQGISNRGLYKNVNFYENPKSRYKRDNSPTFGSPNIENKQYQIQNQRIPNSPNYKIRQQTSPRYGFIPNLSTQIQKSRNKKNPMKISKIDQNKYQINQLKNEMKRSKFLNYDTVYL